MLSLYSLIVDVFAKDGVDGRVLPAPVVLALLVRLTPNPGCDRLLELI